MKEREWGVKSQVCEGRMPDGYAFLCQISKIEGFEGSIHSIYCNYHYCDRLKMGRDWYEAN